MITHHYEITQGTDEWKAARTGVITASEVGEFVIEQPEVRLTKAQIAEYAAQHGLEVSKADQRKTKEELEELVSKHVILPTDYSEGTKNARALLISQKLAEVAGCDKAPDFDSYWMKRGRELEPLARHAFAEFTGLPVTECGIIINHELLAGCSPDGVIEHGKIGLEIKCLEPKTHIFHLLKNRIPSEYIPQIRHSLAASDYQFWYYCGYCPGLPLHIVKFDRAQLKADLHCDGLASMREERERSRLKLSELWDNARREPNENEIF